MQVLLMTVKTVHKFESDELAGIEKECNVHIMPLTSLGATNVYSIEFLDETGSEHVSTLLHLMSDNV